MSLEDFSILLVDKERRDVDLPSIAIISHCHMSAVLNDVVGDYYHLGSCFLAIQYFLDETAISSLSKENSIGIVQRRNSIAEVGRFL